MFLFGYEAFFSFLGETSYYPDLIKIRSLK